MQQMTFKWKIRKVGFFSDQLDEKGEINYGEAIEEFHNFPWKEQLEEIKLRKMTSSIPTICFVNNELHKIEIFTTNLNHFEVYYQNKSQYANIKISNDFLNQNISIEDLIKLFFTGEIEKNLNLKTLLKEKIDKKTTRFDINEKNDIKLLTNSFIWLLANIVAIFLLSSKGIFSKENLSFIIFIQVFFLCFWLPGIFLYVTYKNRNSNSRLSISSNDKTIEYSDSYHNQKISRNDVKFCYFIKTESYRVPWYGFEYLRIELNNGKSIVITCLLADLNKVVETLNLHYKEYKSTVPTL